MSSSVATSTVYVAFIRNAFLKMLAYRLRYYTGILTYLLFVSVYFFIWKAVYSSKTPLETINGFTFTEMVTYVAVGWISRSFYFSNIDSEMNELVRTGQISVFLLRPVNFQTMMFAQAIGESLFRFFFFSIPIGVVILYVFPIQPPASLETFLLFCLSTLLAFGVLVAVNFIIGLLAFSLKSIDGVMRAKHNLLQLFSGLLLPLSFFPTWFQSLLDFLPFKAISYIPLLVYLNKVPQAEIWGVLAGQLFWIVALVFIGILLWKKAMAKLSVQGG
ncbi:MAG: ABC-2 family transporter protein [Deltaproteobacteria bacterium]|nr:ABC-2 family transporter protein [Deltaproteobacteria bacterium]